MSTITLDNNNMNKNELIRQYKHSNLIIGPDNDMFDLGLDGIDLLYFSLSGELEVKDMNGIIGSFSVDDPDGDFISVAEVKKFTSEMKKFVCIPDFTGTIEVVEGIPSNTVVVKGSHEFTIQYKEK